MISCRITPRTTPVLPGPLGGLFSPLFAAATALAAGAAVFTMLGVNPLEAYGVMLKGALGSGYALSEILVKACPLILTGLAVALAATMLLWNIGCEGQFVMGAVASGGFALFVGPGLPAPVLIPLAILAGAAGGMLWALVPGLLKARFQVNEILSTLLLNYVAIIYAEHLYFGPWRDPMGMGFPGSPMLERAAWLPRLAGTRAHLGLVIGLAAAVILYVLLKRSRWGFSIRTMGLGPLAARYAGMPVGSRTVAVMALSGALAGLAGMAEVLGVQHKLQQGLAVGYGYDGIIVAWLARLNPLGVPVAALFLAVIIVGGEQLQSTLHLPSTLSKVLEAMLLLGFLAGEFLNRNRVSIRLGRPKSEAGENA